MKRTTFTLLCTLAAALAGAGTARGQTAELAEVVAGDGAPSLGFGYSVSISGDRLLAGSPFDEDLGSQSGSAYVFERDPSGAWVEVAKLLADDGAAQDLFGIAVALSGERALIGAPGDGDKGLGAGSAYVFERQSSGAWTQTAKVLASDGATQDEFGIAVALSGEHALVGAPYNVISGSQKGSAYAFERQSTGAWIQAPRLTASDGQNIDIFGVAVSIDGDRALIGAPGDDDHGVDSGSAYVFERGANGWAQAAKVTASDGETNDLFGTAVSLSGARALVGARFEDERAPNAGAAYVFERDALGAWSEEVKLTASDGRGDDVFGWSVALAGDVALVAAEGRDALGMDSGAAYVFARGGPGTWNVTAELLPADGGGFDHFGWSAALAGDRAALGANGKNTFAGATYLFDLEPLSGGGVTQLSVLLGGTQPLEIDAGHLHAGERYLVLGSASGTSPGIPLAGGLLLPLAPDPYFARLLERPNRPPLSGSLGVLNAAGHADGAFSLVPTDVALAGLTLHHAFVAFTALAAASATGAPPSTVPIPSRATFASNALALALLP